MPLVWIMGNSGVGKSTLCGLLQARGCTAFDADNDGYSGWISRTSSARATARWPRSASRCRIRSRHRRFPLAPLFEQVMFVEPDPDMLTEARTHAAAARLSAAELHRATAEDLGSVITAPARVAAFRQSIHRTDRLRAARSVYDIAEPGGSIVLITHNPNRPPPPQPADTSLIPHDDIRRLVRQYLGVELRSGARPTCAYGTESFEQTLARTPSVHPCRVRGRATRHHPRCRQRHRQLPVDVVRLPRTSSANEPPASSVTCRRY